MTYEGMFDEIECKFELERQKKYIQKQASIIFALERELEEKNNYLDINRFNLLTLGLETKFIALGGINEKNFKKINLLNCEGFSGISWIKKNRPNYKN